MAGQTISDRLLAAKHSIAGQGLAKSVCKATTEELLGPKKKHLDYLVHCTNEPNVSIPQMANLLIERSQNTSWIVVYKALITTHHLMCYGNERYTQYLASSSVSFQLSNFVDKSGVQSAVGARTGYDMSPFIRRYAKYLNEKALSYRAVAFDFCKVKRGKEEGTLRSMNSENLLKTLPTLQNQLDALLEFDCSANDLTNGVINMCFMLLFRDLIRLFACYNDGIINLLEKYFEMNKKQCREALDLYKKFLIRMDRVGEFLKVAENIGIDKGDIPDLTRAPNSLLDALEQHLASLEGNTPTAVSNQKSLKSGVSVLSHTSNAFGSVDESFKQAAVAEEEAALNQYRATLGSPSAALTNPFLNEEPSTKTDSILDLFGSETISSVAPASQPSNALDDLLSLGGNPFADAFSAPTSGTTNGNMFGPPVSVPVSQPMWANGFSTTQNQATFATGNFSNMFNATEPSVFDPLGTFETTKQPQIIPQNTTQPQRPVQPSKILTGDLESSLTSLVENLTMDSGNRNTQWNSPKNQPKVAGGGWQPQPMSATNAASYRPMAQPMMGQPMLGQPMMAQPMMGGQSMMGQPMGMPMQYSTGMPQTTGSPKVDNPADLLCRGYPFVPHSSTIVVQGSTEDAASPGTVIEIKCLTKFRNLNQDSKQPYQPSKLTCSEGHWVGIPPICVPADECSQPPKVAYSTMTSPEAYHSKLPNKFPVKSQVLYQCVPGYILEGSEILSCLVGGFWLPSEPPTCLRTGTSYYFEVNGIDAVLVTTATGAGVLSLLLIICLVVVCKRKKHIARAVTIPTPVQRQDMGDHAVLLHQPDRLALIAFADGIHNGQSPLPTYDEATRDRGPSLTVNRLQRPHWPSMAIRRARNSPNPDMVHVTRHGSFASHTPSTRSAGDSMGSTDTMAVSEGSTNVTLDTASSYSGSQAASCRAHCGSLASFDTCSVINTEGVPLLEESELEEIQACDTISLVLENPSLSDNASHKLSTTSADFP